MNVTPEVVILGCSGVGALVIHAVVFGVVAGRMINRISHVEAQQREIKNQFVTKGQCEGVTAVWEAKMQGMLDTRALKDQQNADDHERLLIVATEINESVEKVSDCLIKIQKKQEC